MTPQYFQDGLERLLISGIGSFCMAEIANANGYPDQTRHWRSEVDRIVFIDFVFFIISSETTRFDRRAALAKTVANYDSTENFRRFLLAAKRLLATRYLKNPNANLKLPNAEST